MMRISVENQASKTLDLAAEELRSYLSRMLPEDGEELAVSLLLEDSGPETAEKPDRFRVSMTARGGVIAGNRPRSVLLGVYHYLRYLGCRFLGPEPECEVVPRISPANLPADYVLEASLRHRGVCIEGADSPENVIAFIRWLPKIGCNSFFLQFKSPYAFLSRWFSHEKNPLCQPEPFTPGDALQYLSEFEQEVRRRDLLLHEAGHGWTGEALGYESVSWNPNDRPLDGERRLMAAQVDGVRGLHGGVPANTNLCFHCGQAVDAFASLVVEYAENHPAVDYLHVWLADEYNNVCECEDCQKTTLSDQYVELLNEIDQRLTAAGRKTKLVFLLYQELLWPPIRARLAHPERFVLMFAPISRTFEASYHLEGPEREIPPYVRNRVTLPTDLKENLAFLREWQQLFDGGSFVYDYPLGRAHYGDFGYVHIAQVISEDIKKLRQMGLDGYISCQELRVCLPNALPNYVMGLTLLDETASAEDLIREYFEAAYGEYASEVKAYLSALSRLSSCDYINGKGSRTDPEMAQRMAEIVRICEAFTVKPNGIWGRLLEYHRQYILHLAKATGALASGDLSACRSYRQALRDFICTNELAFQSYLDVYRVLEVTEKYTGFPSDEDGRDSSVKSVVS